MELQNKTALVTGAGSRIGKATALRLAAAGARVIVHANKDDETRATVDEIVRQGGDAFGLTADIRDDPGFGQELESRTVAKRQARYRRRECGHQRGASAYST